VSDAPRIVGQMHVPWDDLRERRVLGKVEAKLAERRAMRRRRPWLVAAGLGGGLFVAAAAVLAVLALRPAGEEPAIAVAELPVPSPQVLTADESALTLPDGSRAQMLGGARVDVAVQSAELVQLVQRSGVVRYEVTPNPDRRFVVDADGVEVRVIGTVFTVSLGEDDVRVAVERGRVEVAGTDRVSELGAGDELKLDRAVPVDEPIVLDDDVVIEIEPEGGQSKPREKPAGRAPPQHETPSAKELLDRADAARMRGRLGEAAEALSELVRRYPRDPLAYSSSFQLGKVQRSRGQHAAAAAAFTACHRRAPSGALAEDARAEAAVSWLAAGKKDRAAAAAQAYLDRYASGAHRARMQRILDKAE
jgi:transmembrane sensor